MSTIRKYRPIAKTKKPLINAERSLLVGVVGLTAVGFAQPSIVSFAFNDTTPASTMVATTKKPADYTPVGTIKPATPPAPEALQLKR